MFTGTYFQEKNAAFHAEDPWLHTFFKLHVPSNYLDDRSYKVHAVETLRGSTVYKQTKINAVDVESNLLNHARLSPLAFYALAVLHEVNVVVILGLISFCTLPKKMAEFQVCRGVVSKYVPRLALYVLPQVAKPLYAVSHYTVRELESLADHLRLPKGSKLYMHHAISEYVAHKFATF
jgi:hypothetical protein